MEEGINSENCVVCLMDIMGYRQLVDKQIPKRIYKVLLEVISLKDKVAFNEKLKDRIKIQVMSDSVLFLLDLDNLPIVNAGNKHVDNDFQCLQLFLLYTAIVSLRMVISLKYFLRGGIAIGQYYQQALNKKENQFIFSKAMIEAHELEKMADVPRILVSKKVYEYVKKKGKDWPIKEFKIARGCDGLHFLDIYSSLEIYPDKKELLKGVKEAFCFQIKQNKGDIKIIRKYYWFQNYHNQKIEEWGKIELGEDYESLLVDISPYAS